MKSRSARGCTLAVIGAMIAVAGALRLADARQAGEIRAQARWALNTLGRPAAAG